jgi:hypothetical protein
MSEVLRAVVTSEDFAPPRDVCHNTQWEAAGYWIARAKTQFGELPQRAGDAIAGDYRCPHHPGLAACECYCQFVGCSVATCPDDGLFDGIDILAEARWFTFYLGAVVTHASTTPLDHPSGEALREASRGLLRLVPFLWTVIRRLGPVDESKIKAELAQEAYEPVASMRARAKEKSV